jgi:hypothetical protein
MNKGPLRLGTRAAAAAVPNTGSQQTVQVIMFVHDAVQTGKSLAELYIRPV